MVYGNANLLGVPWETIIKIYRQKLGRKQFKHLNEYANDFFKFLSKKNSIITNEMQEEFVEGVVQSYLEYLKETFLKRVKEYISEKNKITRSESYKILKDIIIDEYNYWIEFEEEIPSLKPINDSCKKIRERYGDAISKSIIKVFDEYSLTKRSINNIVDILTLVFTKGVNMEMHTGIVFAGFGELDIFPAIEAFGADGYVLNKFRYLQGPSIKIGDELNASIVPFAQSEMVHTFMEGIDPVYQEIGEKYLAELLGEYGRIIVDTIPDLPKAEKVNLIKKIDLISKKILDKHRISLKDLRKNLYIGPITTVVTMLPKDELAAMAESLVNLTSFKRKVSLVSETVGGPIDVALISKGDGFIWIKRKHYFDMDLNPQFVTNYYREENNAKKEK